MQTQDSKKISQEQSENIHAKGFVFDIDGTLVSREIHQVDDYLIGRMVGTLKLLRPVIFATGRSVDSVNEMVLTKLLTKLTDSEKENLLKNLFIISNNGANIFSVSFTGGKLVFKEEQKKHLQDGDQILEVIKQEFADRIAPKEKDFVSRSKNGVVTIVLKEIGSITVSEIESTVMKFGFTDFQMMKSGEKTIDITARDVDKESGIRFICSKRNIKGDLLARFGDQYQEGGNDSRMLSYGIPIKVTDPDETKDKIQNLKIAHNATLGARNFEKRGTSVSGLYANITRNRIKANSLLEILENLEHYDHLDLELKDRQFSILIANEIMENFFHKTSISIVGVHAGGLELAEVVRHYLVQLGYMGRINILQTDTNSSDLIFSENIHSGDEVYILDDFVVTGKTIAKVAEKLIRLGAQVHMRIVEIATTGKVKNVDEGGMETDFVKSHFSNSVVGYKKI